MVAGFLRRIRALRRSHRGEPRAASASRRLARRSKWRGASRFSCRSAARRERALGSGLDLDRDELLDGLGFAA
ncbi:MAG: hypothetical protein KA225_02155, partial [Thauera sp.]|nr:hypothetical protein [Thauera sp.]